ncbi:hypothetical protein NC651_022067 [Populus alba x Populus x berolinensis]|nr:hypothetical protein NC651_022067 [Populus alba x Populus x berolinensis]
MGNCCFTPSGASSSEKQVKGKKKKQNPFFGDSYAVTNGSGNVDKLWVLKEPTGRDILAHYDLGRELGRGEFGITYLCTDVNSGDKFACKSISKKKLRTAVDIDDVRREVEIMKHLPAHPNIVTLKASYEDDTSVHIVMELCEGGELFDRIVARGHYTERAAAAVMRTIVEVVQVGVLIVSYFFWLFVASIVYCFVIDFHGDFNAKLKCFLFLESDTESDTCSLVCSTSKPAAFHSMEGPLLFVVSVITKDSAVFVLELEAGKLRDVSFLLTMILKHGFDGLIMSLATSSERQFSDLSFPSMADEDDSYPPMDAKRTPICIFFKDVRHVLKLDELGLEIAQIAFPAALAFTADPIASLVDTAFIGRIGPVELAAVGVSIALFNQVSRIAIFPLVSVTTSFVAEEDAIGRVSPEEEDSESLETGSTVNSENKELIPQNYSAEGPYKAKSPVSSFGIDKIENEKRCIPSASSALVIGAILGLIQAIFLISGAKPLLNFMGVGSVSTSAVQA